MPKSNVDVTGLPAFSSLGEAEEYFRKRGKLVYFGWNGSDLSDRYAIYTFRRRNGVDYYVYIYDDGRVEMQLKDADLYKNF